jgi:four helix bundle protein
MAFAARFEDLEIWQQAQELALHLYRLFGSGTAAAKDYGFVDQMRRASVSVSNNIAEGFEAGSSPEFARFLRIAKRSCAEVRSMLYLAERLDYLDPKTASAQRESAELLSKRIAAFLKKLN